MRRPNPGPNTRSSEKLGSVMTGRGRDERRRRESRDREQISAPTPIVTPQRRVMQAYPAYPNSSVISSSPMSISGSSSGVGRSPNNGSMSFTIAEGPRSNRLIDPGRQSNNDEYELPVRQAWRSRREIAPHSAPSSGREVGESVSRSPSGRSNRGGVGGGGGGGSLPSSMMPPSNGAGGREKVLMKRSERDERSGRRSSKDDVLRQKLLESNMESLTMEHFVVDKPVNRRSRSNLNGNQNQKAQRVTVIEPTHKPIKSKVDQTRPQTITLGLKQQQSREQIDMNNNNNEITPFPSPDSEKGPIPTSPSRSRDEMRAHATQVIQERAALNRRKIIEPIKPPSNVDLKMSNTPKSKPSKERVPHPFARNIRKSTTNFELSSTLDSELPEVCSKCQVFSKKLKTQVQTTKNLQRQNGCLESIITQKRNLVEQLTRQIRGLMKENFQLSKGAGLEPGQESVIPADSMSVTTVKSQPKSTNGDLAASSSEPMLLTTTTVTSAVVEVNTKSSPGGNSSKTRTTVPPTNRNRSTPANRTTQRKFGSSAHKNPDMMEEYDKQIESLQNSNEALQKRVEKSQSENLKTSRFLTDLLYTLNARGYESITDFEGSIVDLYRCRGDHLLDLKGRDARARTPVKRMTPQETLLKAVIGSQEKLIQNLFVQLDSRTREALLGSRLSSESGTPEGNSSDRANRNAALEGEILALVCLIEGACQRNPEVFHILQDQALSDREAKHSSGMNANNVVIEAVLDRCQRMLCTGAPPTSPRLRTRGRDSASSSPRSGTPPPYQIRNGSIRGGGNRQSQSQLEEQQTYEIPGPSNEMNHGHTSDLPLIGSSKYNQESQSRPVSRSNLRTMATAGSSSGGSGRQRQLSPPPPPNIRNNSSSGSDSSPRRRPSLPRCRFCGMRFPSHYSLAEINSHIELHNL